MSGHNNNILFARFSNQQFSKFLWAIWVKSYKKQYQVRKTSLLFSKHGSLPVCVRVWRSYLISITNNAVLWMKLFPSSPFEFGFHKKFGSDKQKFYQTFALNRRNITKLFSLGSQGLSGNTVILIKKTPFLY